MSKSENSTERVLLRFVDLRRMGVVQDRATLRRRIASNNFPPPVVLSGNSVAWIASEVQDWLAGRPRGLAPQPRHIEKLARQAAE